MIVPRGLTQAARRHSVEQTARQDREVGEDVGEAALRCREAHHDRRVVGVRHPGHRREIVQPRVPRGRVARRVQGPHHVAGGGRRAVLPADTAVQSEAQGLEIGGPDPRAREIRPRHERRVVAGQRREQHVALHLLREGMDRDQRVHALELRAGRKHDRAATPRRAAAARAARDHHPQEPGPTCPSPHARILAAHHRAREIPPMLAALARRLAAGLAVVAGVATLTFFLLRLAPGDPVERLLGPAATAEQLAAQRQALGLDRPLPAQYAAWLARVAAGEWGRSIASGRPVRAVLGEAWPATAALVGLSLLLSYLLGIAVGAAQAARGGTRFDTALSVSTVTLFALPGYWLGLMLVLVFTYRLRILPSFGAHGYDSDALAGLARLRDLLRHVALPLATLTLVGIGGPPPLVRGAVLRVRAPPVVTTALAKGLAAPPVWPHHVLRNALVPVVTLLGLSLPALFSGARFVG